MPFSAKFKCVYSETAKTNKSQFDPSTGKQMDDLVQDIVSARFEPVPEQPGVWPARHHADIFLHYVSKAQGDFVEGQEYTVTIAPAAPVAHAKAAE